MKRITFETAGLAKKAGYDIECTHWYDQLRVLNPRKGAGGAMFYSNEGYAPFQAELQTWLRDVHNLHVNPDWFSSDPADWDCQVSEIGNEDFFGAAIYIMDWQSDKRFTSFEDALEEGLKVALGFVIEKLVK